MNIVRSTLFSGIIFGCAFLVLHILYIWKERVFGLAQLNSSILLDVLIFGLLVGLYFATLDRYRHSLQENHGAKPRNGVFRTYVRYSEGATAPRSVIGVSCFVIARPFRRHGVRGGAD